MANIDKAQAMRPSLSDTIDFLNNDYQHEVDDIHSDISAEVNRAEAAEATLQDKITTEQERAETAEKKLTDDLQAETDRAVKIETDLIGKINSEQQARTQGDEDLQAHLEAAEADLEEKITAEQEKITAEQTRAEKVEDDIRNEIAALAGTGLSYDAATMKLNGVQADDITLGMVKLSHNVSHQDEQEFAITADGVASYAPSKAETINQPETVEFANVLSGVTLTVMNVARIGGLIAIGIRIATDGSTTVSAATRIANAPTGMLKGISNAVSNDGSIVLQADAVGISCNKSIEPSKTLYFQIIGFYNM